MTKRFACRLSFLMASNITKPERMHKEQVVIKWKAYILLERGYIPKNCRINATVDETAKNEESMHKGFCFLKPIDTFASCIRGIQTVNSPIKANRYSKVGFFIISPVRLHSPNPHRPETNENIPSQKNILPILFYSDRKSVV